MSFTAIIGEGKQVLDTAVEQAIKYLEENESKSGMQVYIGMNVFIYLSFLHAARFLHWSPEKDFTMWKAETGNWKKKIAYFEMIIAKLV